MSEAPHKEIPRPKDAAGFEDLVLALFREVLRDPDLKPYGRRGQRQDGVDLYGVDRRLGTGPTGIQCKHHGAATSRSDRRLIREIREEVEKAKAFPLPLNRFLFVTTAPRSAALQREARQLAELHEREGRFRVEVLGWEDVEDLLRVQAEVLAWYLGHRLPDIHGPWDQIAGTQPAREGDRPFVGRRFLSEEVLRHLRERDSGLLLVVGPPGIGKTRFVEHFAVALPPDLAAPPSISFFFSRSEQRTKPPAQCIKTLYYLLGRKHSLFTPRASDVPETLSSQLSRLFDQVSQERLAGTGRKEMMVVDALDESEDPVLALRLLPKPLPPGIFLLLASRPGPVTEGFAALPGAVRIEIDPLSAKNLADASQYLRQELPRLSPGAAEALALALRGNFLVLRLFALHAQTRGLDTAEALEAARGLGRTDDLLETYSLFWSYLQEDLARRAATDTETALELVGLLSALFEPVTREQACRFLGWSGARLDRLLGSIRPYVEIRRKEGRPGRPPRETLELFHETFDQFVQERLLHDLPGLHERVVRSYAGTGTLPGGLARLDDYGLHHLVRHAFAASPRQALRRLTPELVRLKREALGSAASVLDDLDLGIEAAVQERDLASACLFGLVRNACLMEEKKTGTVAEILLRARRGEEQVAWDKAEILPPASQILVAAEIALLHPEGQGAQALELTSRIEGLALAVEPNVVEEVAVRLAASHPHLALRLAAQIPEPEGRPAASQEEPPTPERCLMRVFGRLARTGPDRVRLAATELAREQGVYARFAIADALLEGDPAQAFAVLDEVLVAAANEQQASIFSSQVIELLLLRLPDLDPPARGVVLPELLARFPHLASSWTLVFYTEEWLGSAPEEWQALLASRPSGAGRDFLRWRLAEAGHLPRPEPEELEAIGLRDLALAERVARTAGEDPSRAAALVRSTPWRWRAALLRATARIVERLWPLDPERASVLGFLAVASQDADAEKSDLGGYLDMLRVTVPHARSLRARTIREAYDLADRFEAHCGPARIAVARVLASAVAAAGPDGPALFRSLVAEQDDESGRLVLGSGILHNLPAGAVTAVAAELCPPDGDSFPLAPERRARLLTVAASRLLDDDADRAAGLLALAAELCGAVEEDEGEIFHTRMRLIETALRLRPGFVWEVYPRCGGSEHGVKIALEPLLKEQLGIEEDRRLRIVREALNTHFLTRRPREKRTVEGLLRSSSAYRGLLRFWESVHVRTKWKATPSWFSGMPDLMAGYLEEKASGKTPPELRVGDVHGFLSLLAHRHWDLVFRILRDPRLAPVVPRFGGGSLDRAVFASGEGDPSLQLLDLSTLARAGEDNSKEEPGIQPVLLAATAAFFPGDFLPLFDGLPRQKALGFASHLDRFEPEVSWSPDQVRAFLDRAGMDATGILSGTALVAWLGPLSAPEPGAIDRLVSEAEAIAGSRHLDDMARYLATVAPDAAQRLRDEALRRAVAARSFRECIRLLEDTEGQNPARRREALRLLEEAADEETDDWLLAHAARAQASTDPEAAIRTLSRVGSDLDIVAETLGIVARSVELREESDLPLWSSRVKALTNLSPYKRASFTKNLFGRAVELGLVRSPESLRELDDPNDRISLLLELASRMEPPARDEILAEVEALSADIGNVFSQAIACRNLLQFLREAGLAERELPILRRLLNLVRLGGEASFLAEDEVLHFLSRATPGESTEAAALLWEVTEELAGSSRFFAREFLQASMLARSAALWSYADRGRGREIFLGLFERFREQGLSDVFKGVGDICFYLVLLARAPAAKALALDFLAIVPQDQRSAAADALVKHLKQESESDRGRYPQRRGLYPDITTSPDRLDVIEALLPLCSERMRLGVRFELAIVRGYDDPEGGRQALAAVLQDPAWEYPAHGFSLDARPWVACAAAFGEEGCARAIQALSRDADTLPYRTGDLLAWAFLRSDRRRDLLFELWTAAEAFGSYVR